MNIQSSSLLTPVTKNLQVYNNCIIASEGPNQIAKLGLGNLSIPYDSIFTSRMTLKSQGVDQPIMYGFLGTNVTFLVVKPIYVAANPQQCVGKDLYLEYFFEDEPLIRRTLTNLLILSGNKDHRIPQVYLYNPTDGTIQIDIMVANIDPNEFSTSLVAEYTELQGLVFSDIRSDMMFGLNCTGSTQFEIVNFTGQTQMVIPYSHIDLIQINSNQLIITTNSEKSIKLTFVSEFNAYQAFSRMNWVMESSGLRWLSKTYPGLDTTPPTIFFNSVQNPEVMKPLPISKSDIRFRFITQVIDFDNAGLSRDGEINKANVNLLILNSNTAEQIESITVDGRYAVTFQAKDNAGNSTSVTKNIVVDSTAPVIYYKTGFTTNIMDLTGSTQTPGVINYIDLRYYYIDYVWDAVDGTIPNSAVTISITSGTTLTNITQVGYYTIGFNVKDTSLNELCGTTFLHVVETVPPVITYNVTFTNTSYTMSLTPYPAGILNDLQMVNYAVDSVYDNYDGSMNISNIIFGSTGITYPIIDSGSTYKVNFSVSDSSGNETSETWDVTIIS